MSGNRNEIAELLVQATAAMQEIKSASSTSKKAAVEAYQDIMLLIATHAITTYEGRTAALSGLIVELNEAKKKIQPESEISEHLNEVDGIINRALDLFQKEKKNA